MDTTPTNDMAPVTVLGLGAMGRALAGAFLSAGHPTRIWNRSPGRGDELVAQGATELPTARAAIEASPLVVVCVLDGAASHAILEPVAQALAGRVLVNLASDTPERAREAAAWAAAHDIEALDGAIMVPTTLIGRPEALLLYSGSERAFATHRSTLAALGGAPRYLGPDPGFAALHDLALLDIFYSSMAAFVHALALVGADGVSAAGFLPFANEFFALLPGMAASMAHDVDARAYPGTLDNLRMEATGIGHILEATHARAIDARGLEVLKSTFDAAIAAGHGSESFASIIEVLRVRNTRDRAMGVKR
jgi:3-hydroxyisobutyrate dehydrogenase-like beta-hydroxyacid dehydrogenase